MDPQPLPPPNEPVRPQFVVDPGRGPIRVIVEPPRGGWFGTLLKWAFLGLLLLWAVGTYQRYHDDDSDTQLHEHWHSLSKDAPDKIAIISVEGTIVGDETFLKRQIDTWGDLIRATGIAAE